MNHTWGGVKLERANSMYENIGLPVLTLASTYRVKMYIFRTAQNVMPAIPPNIPTFAKTDGSTKILAPK